MIEWNSAISLGDENRVGGNIWWVAKHYDHMVHTKYNLYFVYDYRNRKDVAGPFSTLEAAKAALVVML